MNNIETLTTSVNDAQAELRMAEKSLHFHVQRGHTLSLDEEKRMRYRIARAQDVLYDADRSLRRAKNGLGDV